MMYIIFLRREIEQMILKIMCSLNRIVLRFAIILDIQSAYLLRGILKSIITENILTKNMPELKTLQF